MSVISRRDFFKRTLASVAASSLVMTGGDALAAGERKTQMGTLIDLTKCNGCKDEPVPKCLTACKLKNQGSYPRPVKDIPLNWPQNKKEDWSKKKHLTDKLTPYNWTFVQDVQVNYNGKEHNLYIQRRCMHCDNPPCEKLCPFGVQHKTEEGAVLIDQNYCMGGAKCRDVCPWNIPQRQAGVGMYMNILPGYVGGGVMYKCNLCIDLVREGKNPACIDACPQNALIFGPKNEVKELAYKKARDIAGFVYGDKENGGTSTFYVSPVPFTIIHKAIMKQKEEVPKAEKVGVPGMKPEVGNFLETANGTALSLLLTPVAGAFAAGWAAIRTMKGEK